MTSALGSPQCPCPPRAHTVVELAVGLLTVDDVEAVRDGGLSPADLEVEPLLVLGAVHVRVNQQVILKPAKAEGGREGRDLQGDFQPRAPTHLGLEVLCCRAGREMILNDPGPPHVGHRLRKFRAGEETFLGGRGVSDPAAAYPLLSNCSRASTQLGKHASVLSFPRENSVPPGSLCHNYLKRDVSLEPQSSHWENGNRVTVLS